MKIQYPVLMRLHFLYIVLLGFLPVIVYSQETGSCAEKLKNAQSLFDKGQVELVPSMLRECMKSGFNREESLAAYKLLIQSYLFEDKLELADSTMLAFLKKNPEYQVSQTDHSSFVHLFNNFKVKPVVQISFHLGTNLPFLTFVDVKTLSSEPGESLYNTKALNLFGSVEAKFELSKKLELNLEAGYSQLSFTNTEEFMGFKKTTYSEVQKRLEVPVTVTFNYLTFGKFTAYGRLGQGAAFNLGSVAKPSYEATDDNNPNSFSGADIERNDSRIKIDLFIQAGTGLKLKTPGGFIFMELRSNFGIFNQIVRGQPSAEELQLPWLINYEDDDFHMNSLNFNIGYTQIFYKPSKRKE
jgi:hypothetical protein